MGEQLWREQRYSEGSEEVWALAMLCHIGPDGKAIRDRGTCFVPVAAGALLIPDGEALRCDLASLLDELALEQDACTYNGVPGPHAGIGPWVERLLAVLRRAACGEGTSADTVTRIGIDAGLDD